MGYRIVYGEEPTLRRKSRLGLWTAAFLLIFVTAVRLAWPEGAEQLRTVLEPRGEAVTAFCRSVVTSAQPG